MSHERARAGRTATDPAGDQSIVETRLHDTAYSRPLNRAVIFARREGLRLLVLREWTEQQEIDVSPALEHMHEHGTASRQHPRREA